MSTTTAERIRPRAAYLAQLPTLDVMTPDRGVSEGLRDLARQWGIDFRLELKLVRPGCRYWLCTQGRQPEPGERRPPAVLIAGWTVGYVTADSLVPNEHGECEMLAYGPDDVGWLQGLDYFQALAEDLTRLEEANERSYSHERQQQIVALLREQKEVSDQLRRLGH
jgi:hypothetical protein